MSHITRLQAENFKKLVAIDVRPGTSAGVVPIRGRNAQGKSSTLDAIMAGLGGAKHSPSRPIRTGQDEAAIRLELDTGEVILRRFTADGKDTIEVTTAEGAKFGSPQAVLNKLFASVAFDPLAFTRIKPDQQLATLRGLVKLDVDVDALNAANQGDYDSRRDKNRELDRENQKLEQMPTYPDLAKSDPVDEAKLEDAIATAAEANALIERRRASREQFADSLDRNRTHHAGLIEQLAAVQEQIATYAAAIADQEKKLAEAEPLPDPVDVSEVQQQLRAARDTNQKIAANKAAIGQKQLVELLQKESQDLTDAMEDRKKLIADAIGRADMPVPGLAFGDGEVLFQGVPLEQASSAEQLRVSTAIGIASSPKLRVMLVRDGSLLDDDGERILAELAAAHDFQLWVEAVDTSGTVGIVLEDGAVASIDGEPAPEPEPIATRKRRAKKPAEEKAAEPAGQAFHTDDTNEAVANQVFADAVTTGLGISHGGERVDPADFRTHGPESAIDDADVIPMTEDGEDQDPPFDTDPTPAPIAKADPAADLFD